MDYSTYKRLRLAQEDRILTVSIDSGAPKNAATYELHCELSRLFLDIADDDGTDIVVLTGGDDAFCAGGDLNWLSELAGDPLATARSIANDRRIQNSLLDLEKPIIAKVKGPAVGLGCTLALFCDFVYATPGSVFADPHVCVGLVAGDGGAVLWPQLIGYARARRYLLTGDPIKAAEAAEIGLITEAVTEEDIDATVEAMARRLREGATYSIRWTKAAINAGLKVTANAIIDSAAGFENVTMLMEDHRIALEAFKSREKPRFKGK